MVIKKFEVMVMDCSRSECENIMCHTYIDKIGYVCHSCQIEFKEYLDKENIVVRTEGDIRKALEDFMSSPRGKNDVMSVDEFFNTYSIK